MARALVLCQAKSHDSPKLQVRGVFTQKKKLWEALSGCGHQIGWKVLDDVVGKEYDSTYTNLCNRLRLVGRATIINAEGERVFLVVDTQVNELRDWDTGEDGKPVLNPVKGVDEPEGAPANEEKSE